MAGLNFANELENLEYSYSTDVMTGGSDKKMYLYYQLISSLKRADSVDIIVSFLMESGVKMLIAELENALKRGAKIRILTGNYLGITQPSALYLIKNKLKDRVDLRFYNEKGRSFHPKSYIFHYKSYSEIYIGSSNISRSALTSGVEWNYRFSSQTDKNNYDKFYQTFEELFQNHSIIVDDEELKRYSKNWHSPAVAKDIERYDSFDDENTNRVTEMDKKGIRIKDQIYNEFLRVREFLGRVPSRMDFFTYADDQIYESMIKHSKENPFKNYLGYLHDLNLLSPGENVLYSGVGREFINYIETTNMSKVYKMPVLIAFYNHGKIRKSVTEEELLVSWKDFFSTGTNWKDLQDGITYEKYRCISDKEHLKKIIQMPVKFLLKSGVGFFVQKEYSVLSLSDDLCAAIDKISMNSDVFKCHMKDAIEYRIMDYYQRRYRDNTN